MSRPPLPPFTAETGVEIRRLDTSDVEDYRAIRLASLESDPEAFSLAYAVEAARPVADFVERITSSAVFGAYAGRHIVGLADFEQKPGLKESHKGRVGGMYVLPEWRGQGISSTLITAVLDYARGNVEQLTLAVAQGNSAAISLSQKFGFEIYGVEPRSLKSAMGYSDAVLMVLMLTSGDSERKYNGPLGRRPNDHPSLSDLGL
jgi:ribosomal protein S18 acetylase RimI-like enzyme